jgi:hypothetical protein
VADQKTAGTEARAVAGAITSMGLADMISHLAIGIAEGQAQLDLRCMEIARFMGDAQIEFGKRPGSNEPDLISLIELGFTPNFYQFVDTVLELRVAVSTKFEETVEQDTSSTNLNEQDTASQSSEASQSQSSRGGYGVNWGWGWWNGGYSVNSSSGSNASQSSASSSFKQKNLSLTTVDAKYSSTYNYAVEASSVVKTKIVPVPPPTILEEIIRAKVQQRKDSERQLRLAAEAQVVVAAQIALAATMSTDASKALIPNSELSGKLDAAAQNLKKGHAALTNEQWSLGGTALDRTAAEEQLAAVTEKVAAIKGLLSDSSADDFDALKKALTGALGGYRDTMTAVNTRLAAMATTGALPAATPPK